MDSMIEPLINLLNELSYYVGIFFCRILNVLYSLFRVLAGTQTVTYHNQERYLIDIFFSDTTVTTVYAGMALIGIILLVVFTIMAVVKKMADLGDKMQASLGEILRKMLTSFLFIISMNFIMIATINITNTLMQSIEYLFDNSRALSETTSHTFTDEEYATMARIFNTIGNFSLNDSSTSRYNLNSCYNEIRPDMQSLEKNNVFLFSYDVSVGDQTQESWQSVLSQIARAHNLAKEQPVDEYDASLSAAMLNAMQYVRVNKNSMRVLESYQAKSASAVSTDQNIDVILWLCATSDAAKNSAYNGTNVSYGDPVRNPYMTGEKKIYNLSQVEEDFSLSWGDFDHLVVIIGGFMMCAEFLGLAINCVARLFNMILLYIVAPPFIATAPFDDGAKFKQWSTAFVIQCFNVFGSIISIRLMLLIIPIVFDSKLVFAGGSLVNMLAKALIIIAAAYTARKANSLISGILAENAGYQSLFAGDAASAVRQGGFGRVYDTAAGALASIPRGMVGKGADIGGSAVKAILKSPFTAASWGYRAASGKSERGNLNRSMAAGGDEGKRAARNFLDMDKSAAMKKYNAGEEKYAEMRSRAHDVLEGRTGGNGDAAGGSEVSTALKNLKSESVNQNRADMGQVNQNNRNSGTDNRNVNSQNQNNPNQNNQNLNSQNLNSQNRNSRTNSVNQNSGGSRVNAVNQGSRSVNMNSGNRGSGNVGANSVNLNNMSVNNQNLNDGQNNGSATEKLRQSAVSSGRYLDTDSALNDQKLSGDPVGDLSIENRNSFMPSAGDRNWNPERNKAGGQADGQMNNRMAKKPPVEYNNLRNNNK